MDCCVSKFVEGYLTISSRRPLLVMSAWSFGAAVFIVVGLLIGGLPVIDTGLDLRSDGVVADRYDALVAAEEKEEERRDSLKRRLGSTMGDAFPEINRHDAVGRSLQTRQGERFYQSWYVEVMFEAVNGNIFDPWVIHDIREFETRLEQLPSYRDFCLASRTGLILSNVQAGCRGLRTSMRFFYGTRVNNLSHNSNETGFFSYSVVPDGFQMAPNSIFPMLDGIQQKRHWPGIDEPVGRLWYFDKRFPNSRLIRSTAPFGEPLPGFSSLSDKPDKQEARNEEFLANELYPFLESWSTDRVKIYYRGPHFFYKYEFTKAVVEDATKVIVSLVLVYIYMAAYTRAPLVALFGMVTVVLSIPMAMVLFKMTGHSSISALNFLALFLLTGIGADNLFILIDAWRQTKRDFRNLKSRLRLTFARAGRSLAACGTTTAVSFFANIFSSVRLLRWFGLFVGLCVCCNLLLCLAMFPPLLLLRERTKRRKVKVDEETSSSVIAVKSSWAWPNEDDDMPAPINHRLSHKELLAKASQESARVHFPSSEKKKCCRWCCRRASAEFNVASFIDIGTPQQPVQKTRRLKRGEHYYSELYAPEDEAGRDVAFNWAESFFGDTFAPMLKRGYPLILLAGLAITIMNCILVIVYVEPSSEFPVLFKPGAHNLGDVDGKREQFTNAPWTAYMETEPLDIQEWPASATPAVEHRIVTTSTTTTLVKTTTLASAVTGAATKKKKKRTTPRLGSGLPPGIDRDLPDSEVTMVSVVFGLIPTDLSSGQNSDVEYDSNFNIEDAATQTFLLQLCDDISAQGDLLAVRRSECLITSFREYLRGEDISFPLIGPDIHASLLNFVNTRRGAEQNKWKSHVGFSNDGRIVFMSLVIITNLPKRMPGTTAWEWSLRWDDFINLVNWESYQLPNCFHTSTLWVRADAEHQLVGSTIMCAVASILFASCAVFWFLADIRLGAMLIFAVVNIILALAALMFAVFKWSFGPIEAVSLIIVVGFSVDYALHLAEAYKQSPASSQYLRVQDALRRTGGALLGAAATSVLTCPPILFCTMTVFVQFGLTLIGNMLLAFVFSTFFFAAALVAMGPMPGGCSCQKWLYPALVSSDDSHTRRSSKKSSDSCIPIEHPSGRAYETKSDCDTSSEVSNQDWTHLSQPSVVRAHVKIAPVEYIPHLIGQTAWQEAEQPEAQYLS